MKKQLLLLILAIMPLVAMADASGICGENLTWTYVSSTGALTIQGSGAMTDYEYMNAPWNSYCNSIKEINIGNEVTTIGDFAFLKCSGLTTVTIPNNVTTIGDYAFENCSSLTTITIPNSVTTIGDGTFWNCSSLTTITIPNNVTTIGDGTFWNCSSLTTITIPNNVTTIGDDAFWNCSSLTTITIPNNVTTIGSNPFSGCSGLNSIIVESGNLKYDSRNDCNAIIESSNNSLISGCKSTDIPNNIMSIGANAFSGCSGLTHVNIPDKVTTIGYGAFSDCSGLTYVNIPDKVTTIEYGTFSGCSGLTYVNIPNNVTIIGNRAFWGCSGLTYVNIPDKVTTIGDFVFEGCSGLTSVYIPDKVTSIGFCAFSGCSGLTSVYIPDKVTTIGYGAFSRCSGLTSIIIPNNVTTIGDYAFVDCSNLASITIGSGMTSIGRGAFSCDVNLSIVNVKVENPIEIDESVFEYIGDNYSSDIIYLTATLNVPIGSKNLYSNAKGWKNFVNINEVDFTPKHKLTYVVDGEEYKVYEIAEGVAITPEPAPVKEGYTFSGWSEIPATMPAEDVTVTGSFTINQYLVTYMIGDELYQKEYVDYGATIILPNVPEREGYSFAWIDAPEKMPAHDITINGAYTSGICGVSNDDTTTNSYTINGYKTDKPRRGVNVIRLEDGTTKKIVVR